MSRLNPYIILSKYYQSTTIVPQPARKFQTGYGRQVGRLIELELTVDGAEIWFADIENLTQKEKELAGASH